VSEAGVTEVPCTAFTGCRMAEHVACRLVVRRVKRLQPLAGDGTEQVIAELKDGPLAHLPRGKYAANAAWVAHAGRPKRTRIINVAARIATTHQPSSRSDHPAANGATKDQEWKSRHRAGAQPRPDRLALHSHRNHRTRITVGGSGLERTAVRLADALTVSVISRGLGLGAAQEFALKIREVAGLFCEGYSSADFRHGPVAAVGAGQAVIHLAVGSPGEGAEHSVT
jgi:hypothetical protein